MHLAHLGVMRKLEKEWINGSFDKRRLEKDHILLIDSYLEKIKSFVPLEFVRKTRSTKELAHMKATEFRLHLLYVAVPTFLNFLPKRMFEHFLLLHCSMVILTKKNLCQSENIKFARQMLMLFVRETPLIYGEAFCTYNVHCLPHLADDVEKFGPADDFSAFCFENKLQKLKNLIRNSGKQLEQLIRRSAEIDEFIIENINFDSSFHKESHELLESHDFGPLAHPFLDNTRGLLKQFFLYKFGKFTIDCRTIRDNCVMLNDGEVIRVRNFVKNSSTNEIFVIGQLFLSKENAYTIQNKVASSSFNECVVKCLSKNLTVWSVDMVKFKMLCVPLIHDEKSYFVSAL